MESLVSRCHHRLRALETAWESVMGLAMGFVSEMRWEKALEWELVSESGMK
jgi:hypothetical protein